MEKIIHNANNLLLLDELSIKKSHVFTGYYDINHFSKDELHLLVHILPTRTKNTPCELALYDLADKKYVTIDKTFAWNWQQGSRLRWNPVDANQVLYNTMAGDSYCASVYDIKKNAPVKKLEKPLYDIDSSFNYGLSLDFERLQILRPGYGYTPIRGVDKLPNAPKEDGIFIVNLQSNKSELLISLADLAQKVDPDFLHKHYINHLCFSPDGKNFMFLHVYKAANSGKKKIISYVSSIDGSNIRAIEENNISSHYCWIDDEKLLLVIHYPNTCAEEYTVINVNTGTKTKLDIPGLDRDGHPSILRNSNIMITDTYPDKNGYQSLILADMQQKTMKIQSLIYHDLRMYGEKRCDLHPSVSASGKHIAVNTTYKNQQKRNILVFKAINEAI